MTIDHQNMALLIEKASKSDELEKVIISLTTQLEVCKAEKNQIQQQLQLQQQVVNRSSNTYCF